LKVFVALQRVHGQANHNHGGEKEGLAHDG